MIMSESTPLGPPQIPFDMGPDPRAGQQLPTVAALCSSYFPGSHSQHTVDRFLMGYEYIGQMQSMVERRQGGESGIKAVQCLEGVAVWHAAQDGRWSRARANATALSVGAARFV